MNTGTSRPNPTEDVGVPSTGRGMAPGFSLESGDVGRTLNTANQFQTPFTNREEELQKLLSTERLRSEQRRKNYLQLKDEHLRLQNEHLNIQVELKQVLEEVQHLKDMKNQETEELLKKIEDKNRQITKLEKNLKENDPEILRLKFAEENEEIVRQTEREKMRLENEKNKYQSDLKMMKLQIEHSHRENMHSIQEIKSNYESEIAQIKAERDEYKSRLIESQLPPDSKRLLELREENSSLKKRIDDANATIETAKSEYLLIQTQIANLAQENTAQINMLEDEITALKDELHHTQKELRKCRNQALSERTQNEELASEIVRLKQNETKSKQYLNDFIVESQQEKDQLQRLFNDERENIKSDLNRLRNDIKNRFEQIQNKEIMIQELEDKLVQKERETIERIRTIQAEDNERIFQLEQSKRSLEITVQELETIRNKNKDELNKAHAEQTRLHEKIVQLQQEIYSLQSKVQSGDSTVQELQYVRHQHRQLHEQCAALQAENGQLLNEIRECKHQLSITNEDLKLYKDRLQASKLNEQELKIDNEKQIVKINRKYDEQIAELQERIRALEKENARLMSANKIEHNKLYLLKAKQCSKIANKLNEFLHELKQPPAGNELSSNVRGGRTPQTNHDSSNKTSVQQNVINELQNIHDKLRTLELYSQQLNSITQSETSTFNKK